MTRRQPRPPKPQAIENIVQKRRSLTGNLEIDEKRVLLSAISIAILAATLNIGARYRDFDRRGRVVLEEQHVFLGNVVQRREAFLGQNFGGENLAIGVLGFEHYIECQ